MTQAGSTRIDSSDGARGSGTAIGSALEHCCSSADVTLVGRLPSVPLVAHSNTLACCWRVPQAGAGGGAGMPTCGALPGMMVAAHVVGWGDRVASVSLAAGRTGRDCGSDAGRRTRRPTVDDIGAIWVRGNDVRTGEERRRWLAVRFRAAADERLVHKGGVARAAGDERLAPAGGVVSKPPPMNAWRPLAEHAQGRRLVLVHAGAAPPLPLN
jgi:hypothetical protein